MSIVRPIVMFVDDERKLLVAMSRALQPTFDLRTFSKPADALEELQRDGPRFAVIVSDLLMPGMTGMRFLERARQLAPFAAQILLTGTLHADKAARDATAAGIFRCISKPCPNAVLAEAIAEAVASATTGRG